MGSDHVLLGTDYPTPMIDAGQVSAINGIEGLTEEDKEKESLGRQRRKAIKTDVKSGNFRTNHPVVIPSEMRGIYGFFAAARNDTRAGCTTAIYETAAGGGKWTQERALPVPKALS